MEIEVLFELLFSQKFFPTGRKVFFRLFPPMEEGTASIGRGKNLTNRPDKDGT